MYKAYTMKIILISFLALIIYSSGMSQSLPDPSAYSSSNIEERLVTLALQNPDLEVADHEIRAAQYQVKKAKRWWISSFELSSNANEFTVKRLEKETAPNGQFYPYYPLYNLSVKIPLDGLFTKHFDTKVAKENLAIAQAMRNSKFRQIKAAVLSSYENYQTNQQLLTVQSQITESSYNEFLQAKQKFRNGQISVDDYNKAAQQYHDQLINKIDAEHNFNQVKIQLEALIGVPLSNVLMNTPAPSAPSDTTSLD
jgi:outer membrane protein TolC